MANKYIVIDFRTARNAIKELYNIVPPSSRITKSDINPMINLVEKYYNKSGYKFIGLISPGDECWFLFKKLTFIERILIG